MKRLIILGFVAAGSSFGIYAVNAAELVAVSGIITFESAASDVPLNQGAPKDAPIFLSSWRGKVKETSKTGLFDGCSVNDSALGEMVAGRLVLTGGGRFEKAGDNWYYNWEGSCDTVNAGSKSETTKCSGSWRTVNGTGRFANIGGNGTWRSTPRADGTEANEWDGTIVRQ